MHYGMAVVSLGGRMGCSLLSASTGMSSVCTVSTDRADVVFSK